MFWCPDGQWEVLADNAYLIPAKVVYEHHADEGDQHAETLEGEHRQAKGAVLQRHAGRVVFTESTILLARQAVAGGAFIFTQTTRSSFPRSPRLCRRTTTRSNFAHINEK